MTETKERLLKMIMANFTGENNTFDDIQNCVNELVEKHKKDKQILIDLSNAKERGFKRQLAEKDKQFIESLENKYKFLHLHSVEELVNIHIIKREFNNLLKELKEGRK